MTVNIVQAKQNNDIVNATHTYSMKKFKTGDLVKPSKNYAFDNKHTATQCSIGVVVSHRKVKGSLLYRIFWWPSEKYFSFDSDGLELMSRVCLHKEKIPKSLRTVKNK